MVNTLIANITRLNYETALSVNEIIRLCKWYALYFYRSKMMLPYTLIAINRKKYEGVYHIGHDFKY